MSIEFTPGPSFAVDGTFLTACKFIPKEPDAIDIGPPEYELEFPSTSGGDGTGSKNHGFRQQRVRLRVVYVAESADAVVSAYQSDVEALTPGPSELVLYGTTFYGCFVDPTGTRLGLPRPTGSGTGTYFAEGEITVMAKRLTSSG